MLVFLYQEVLLGYLLFGSRERYLWIGRSPFCSPGIRSGSVILLARTRHFQYCFGDRTYVKGIQVASKRINGLPPFRTAYSRSCSQPTPPLSPPCSLSETAHPVPSPALLLCRTYPIQTSPHAHVTRNSQSQCARNATLISRDKACL